MGRKLIPALIAAGIVLRVIAVLSFPVYPLVHNTADTEIYDEGARSLARGQGYQWQGTPTAFFPVGWPLVLSGAYRLMGTSPRSGQIMNLLLSLGLLAAAWALTRRLHGSETALRTAAVLAVAPHQVIFPAFLMSEVAFTAFFVTGLWLLSRGTRSIPSLILSGLVTGGATLIRGLALVYPLLTLIEARLRERRKWMASLTAAALFGLALLVPLAPWAVRNHQIFGRWVLVANDGGMNFLMGNHHGATGARHEPAEGLPDLGNEVANDREGYRRGMEFIRSHPLEFVSLLPRKLVRLTAAAPLLTYRRELETKWPRPLALALLGLDQLLHLALWGLFFLAFVRWMKQPRGMRRRSGFLFALSAMAIWTGVHLMYLGGARYFFPMTPVLAGAALSALAPRQPEAASRSAVHR